jgi:hypothetical protein
MMECRGLVEAMAACWIRTEEQGWHTSYSYCRPNLASGISILVGVVERVGMGKVDKVLPN